MKIRQSTMDDLTKILEMYSNARKFMAEHGNPDQWGTSKPSKEVIINDITEGNSYVCEEDCELLAVFCYFKGPDSTYAVIEDGKWINDEPYSVPFTSLYFLLSVGLREFLNEFPT